MNAQSATVTPLSQRNIDILKERLEGIYARGRANEMQVGDFVRFSCGTIERVSHLWDNTAQTSDLGSCSFYLSDGHCTSSGSLNPGTEYNKFLSTEEWMEGQVWFFNEGHVQAHNAAYARALFRVWECLEPSKSFSRVKL